ncbi:hypothetical protein Tco_0469134 [Tanacetum coccineum]
MALPCARVGSRVTPTAIAETVTVSRNVRRCLTAARSGVPVNANRLSTPSEQLLHVACIIRNHNTTDGTIVPIFKIFDRFKNTSRNDFRSLAAKVLMPGNNCKM